MKHKSNHLRNAQAFIANIPLNIFKLDGATPFRGSSGAFTKNYSGRKSMYFDVIDSTWKAKYGGGKNKLEMVIPPGTETVWGVVEYWSKKNTKTIGSKEKADIVVGSSDADTMTTLGGGDWLVGGAGKDKFGFAEDVLSASNTATVIQDFNPKEDVLDFDAVTKKLGKLTDLGFEKSANDEGEVIATLRSKNSDGTWKEHMKVIFHNVASKNITDKILKLN